MDNPLGFFIYKSSNQITINQINMKQINNQSAVSPYNEQVRGAYFQILKEARAMLATIEHEELRYSMVRDEKKLTESIRVIHEFISPLIYLRLECHSDNRFMIHYGFEQINSNQLLSNRTALFTRSVYKLTSKEQTEINIEDCVHNDWCITECSALYDYVENQMRYHEFHLIKYKPASNKRKQMKAVA
jgi:hypothetical protein